MIAISLISNNECLVTIDTSVFNENVISKVLYWHVDNFIIYWSTKNDKIQNIILQNKNGNISSDCFDSLKKTLNQNFIDFKNRDIILQETKNIRDILYIKAFANNDEFEDYNIIAE